MNEKEQILNLIERLDEISPNKKAQNKTRALNTLSSKEDNVKTFLIITAENPMGSKGDNRTNRRANNSIVDYLNTGNYAWQPVRGKYGNTENSKIIFNISLDEAIRLGLQFHQESFIFGEKNNDQTLYHLYVINEDKTGYNMVETQDKYEKVIGSDFYTAIDNKNDISMNQLTNVRQIGSLPIAGRYRVIDFSLSNMVNSGITNVGIFAKEKYRSLTDHL
jgi:hypothetical protein